MIRQPISRRRKTIFVILGVLCCVGGYTAVSLQQHVVNPRNTTIPTWGQMWDGVERIVRVNPRDHTRWVVEDAKATATRLFLGLALGIAGAFVLGILMGGFGSWEAFWSIPTSVGSAVPPTAALAIFFALFGIELKMYTAMIAFGIIPTLALATGFAVRDVPLQVIQKAYTLGASEMEVIWNVVVRQIMPKFIEGVRLQIGPVLVFLIAAEMVCAGEGLGYRIRIQFMKLDMAIVYPYIAVLVALRYGIDQGLRVLLHRVCPWYQNGRR